MKIEAGKTVPCIYQYCTTNSAILSHRTRFLYVSVSYLQPVRKDAQFLKKATIFTQVEDDEKL